MSSEVQIESIRGELEIVQQALKLQTRRCRQLVAEYTRRLQLKEQQYQSERLLREDQLARVLRALLIFEARLRQEQIFISHQLREKDYVIKKQHNDIRKLLSSHYCKNCNQYYSPSSNLESLDSSSDYVLTSYQDYQSSNFESLDSSSETYATISEKEYESQKTLSLNSGSGDEVAKMDSEPAKTAFQKNKNSKDSLGRRGKKIVHRKSVGNYFEVLKLRNDSNSICSNEDNTSNDYDNLDSLPTESITDKINIISERIESIFTGSADINNSEIFDGQEKVTDHQNTDGNDSSSNVSASDCNNTVISKSNIEDGNEKCENVVKSNNCCGNNIRSIKLSNAENDEENKKNSLITESIPAFEDDGDTNDNWYASASDQEDDEHRDIYRNNPVLECMNQILLQNINDTLSSPPKSPNLERKIKNSKRVKFSDEEDTVQKENIINTASLESLKISQENESQNGYETPIQKLPNFYETPQSIYSNDYEQILSKCSETFQCIYKEHPPSKIENLQEKEINKMSTKLTATKNIDFENVETKTSHVYVDMDTKSECDEKEVKIVRKSKILRTPPALPPKPANLVSKYKISLQILNKDKINETGLDSEPDYCSISELNLPTEKHVSFKKINVVAEINIPRSERVQEKCSTEEKEKKNMGNQIPQYDSISLNEPIPNLVAKKNIEKVNIQIAKQTAIKSDTHIHTTNAKTSKQEPEIPKLPQVSEIIIPNETDNKQEDRISHDNYVKNNSQILKLKSNRSDSIRRPIVMGTSVSNLITSFNNQQLLSELNKKPERTKLNKRMFSSFESLQNLDKPTDIKFFEQSAETPPFEKFDLSQNFEEFNLDDCEIGEEYHIDLPELSKKETDKGVENSNETTVPPKKKVNVTSPTRVEVVRATNDIIPRLSVNTVHQFKKQLECEKNKLPPNNKVTKSKVTMHSEEPTYEHFLECTGLSSKSILTPSRLLSNHKSMLKPKDVKLRSKVRSNNVSERHSSTIKYWSEPYL